MDDTSNVLVFLLVLGLRLLIPLAIPRYPLPAIVAAMVLDAIDQTIFQLFTSLNLDGYQSYDKALDIYYLTIAYLAAMRNWNNLAAFEVARFLLYYRLVGVLLFEATEDRAMLLIFPNTFEYFFIFYELVRLRWEPRRMTPRLVIGAAAAIWIFIKLPQEYWIHIAQRDVTDTLREYPALIPLLAVAVGALLGAGWWAVTRRCPPADRRPSFADPLVSEGISGDWLGMPRIRAGRGFDWSLIERIVLVSLVSITFSQILPNVDATGLEISIAVALVIVGNTLVSAWLARRGIGWRTQLREFAAMATINIGLALAFDWFLPVDSDAVHFGVSGASFFFLMLLTLLVLLYDNARPFYTVRLQLEEAQPRPA
jgi:hypothetical protein